MVSKFGNSKQLFSYSSPCLSHHSPCQSPQSLPQSPQSPQHHSPPLHTPPHHSCPLLYHCTFAFTSFLPLSSPDSRREVSCHISVQQNTQKQALLCNVKHKKHEQYQQGPILAKETQKIEMETSN